MKITVITVAHNAVDTIADTINSVAGQAYPDVEHIIIDGASTDGTLDIIEQYRDKITKFVSKPDHGIYDAMNKGINMAKGDIIGFLNADDVYADKDILVQVVTSPRSSTSCNVRLNETGGQDGQAIQRRRNSQNTQGSRANGLVPGCDPKIQRIRTEFLPLAAEIGGIEGLRSLEILIAAYMSARDGKRISFPLEY